MGNGDVEDDELESLSVIEETKWARASSAMEENGEESESLEA